MIESQVCQLLNPKSSWALGHVCRLHIPRGARILYEMQQETETGVKFMYRLRASRYLPEAMSDADELSLSMVSGSSFTHHSCTSFRCFCRNKLRTCIDFVLQLLDQGAHFRLTILRFCSKTADCPFSLFAFSSNGILCVLEMVTRRRIQMYDITVMIPTDNTKISTNALRRQQR